MSTLVRLVGPAPPQGGAKGDAPYGQNIHSPIGIALQHFHDLRVAADARYAVRHGQQHAKVGMFSQAFVDHGTVTRFEDMQPEFSAGLENDVQGEQRNAIWPHRSHR